MGIQNASLEIDSQGKFNLSLNKRVRDMESEEFLLRDPVYLYRNNDASKDDFIRKRLGSSIGSYALKFALLYPMGGC